MTHTMNTNNNDAKKSQVQAATMESHLNLIQVEEAQV